MASGRRRLLLAAAVSVVLVATLVVVLLVTTSTPPSTRSSSPSSSAPSPRGRPAPTTTAPPTTGAPGPLRTRGTTIVDRSGQVVQLTGVSVQGMESANAEGTSTPGVCNNGWKPLIDAQVAQIAGYGLNSVRLPIAWGNLEPTAPTVNADGTLTHHWNASYVAALTDEVRRLGEAHLYVVLDMHQSTWSPRYSTPATAKRPGCPGQGMPVWLNPSGQARTPQRASCEFYAGVTEPGVPGTAWSDFAAAEAYVDAALAGVPGFVAQDVVNEPYCGQPTTNLTGFYQAVTPVIARANPSILLMLEDKADPGTYELDALPDLPNLVLSIHLHEDYWSDPGAGQAVLPYPGQVVLADNYQRAARWGVPLYVGEFYAFDITGNQNGARTADAAWAADTAAFLAYCTSRDISWSYWSWIHKVDWTSQPSLPPSVLEALGATVPST